MFIKKIFQLILPIVQVFHNLNQVDLIKTLG